MTKLLIVDDEERVTILLRGLLENAGYSVDTALTGEEALHIAEDREPDVALLDLRLPGMDGLYVLGKLRSLKPTMEVIMMTAYASVENAVEAMKAGASDYIIKPFREDDIVLTVKRAAERLALRDENTRLKREIAGIRGVDEIVGNSPVIRNAVGEMLKAAPLDINVLIRGESGTGKTLFARLIHKHSARAQGPYVEVNCASFPENLLENELFGHEKEAFTGAVGRKKGKVEIAHAGTLFLDEVADMSHSLQAKLLKVIEDRTFFRVGGEKPVTVDCRFLFATNVDIEDAVEKGGFRRDLYYRMNVFTIRLPALRDHMDDLPLLVEHILRRMGSARVDLAPSTLKLLSSYSWPGSVRELENVIQSALVRCDGDTVLPEHLPSYIDWHSPSPQPDARPGTLEDAEESMVRTALRKAGGNKSRASDILGISRKRLYTLIRKLGIDA
ncbi:MAG: sigma-54-dependent Fis family transcriptional regulator [Planctomycetes bacterium]|nr:sigma-54-dependent Fis family transcriptional regulator [Planctomycetota bacterium]